MQALLLLGLLCCNLCLLAEGHGYLAVPASRNTILGATYEPQSANTGGVCGTITSGSPNFNDAQWMSSGGTFNAGQTFTAEVVITAHHKGHFEFRLCPDSTDLTQSCFDQHLLERSESSPTYSPRDASYPGRWYLPPSGAGRYTMDFTLPETVVCEHCILQWTYITGNSCVSAGYKQFYDENDAAGHTSSAWHMGWMGSGNDGTCSGREASQYVGGAPEKFWSCADIKIVASGAPTSLPTTAPPTSSPTPPTEAPTANLDTPTSMPTSGPSGSCAASTCNSCVSIANNPQSANDDHCAPCASGQPWWPCNVEGLCECGNGPASPTEAPTPSGTPSPPVTPPPTPTSTATELPSSAPTEFSQPTASCDTNCDSCVSIANNPQSANDDHCAPCPAGQPWWPCNVEGLCECTHTSTTVPTPSGTTAPSHPGTPPPTSYGGSPTPAPTTGEGTILERLQGVDWSEILTSQQPDLTWKPSAVYKPAHLLMAVDKMTGTGVGQYKLLPGGTPSQNRYALVNIAAFLAQSMHETIQYDACDENNWDSTSGYTAANACGQLGQSYQDYNCSPEDAHMQCEVDPDMEIIATTHAKWYGAPAPLFCGPRSKVPKAPKWDLGGWCDPNDWASWRPWTDAQEFFDALAAGVTCQEYEQQKAGRWTECGGNGCPNTAAPNFGQLARTDVEGCCWWGRGVIQTTGVCNFGKLNYFAGARAASEGRTALFADVDFCANPQSICTSVEHPDLKWVAGLFYWSKEVQGFPTDNAYGFDYMAELESFTDAGEIADSGFIDKCSGVVNRGCPLRTGCPAGPVHEVEKRAANFRTVLSAFGFPWTDNSRRSSATPIPVSTVESCGSGCASCVRVFGNPQSATDRHCAPCATGQEGWPCSVPGLCTCLHPAAVDALEDI
eukprot:TRINITY_DN1469_c0_g2_i1.p1 TRINITY_DN1469_c0_g2~~TRINITY_DN1469_c0_g2_i1.p1  ORF type:complete len:898 (+),score=114.66 TRINITY_DN1469_c0_g2_i1:98-2791(+)